MPLGTTSVSNHFHDTLGGCSIREAYDDARMFGYESLAIAAKIGKTPLQSISGRSTR